MKQPDDSVHSDGQPGGVGGGGCSFFATPGAQDFFFRRGLRLSSSWERAAHAGVKVFVQGMSRQHRLISKRDMSTPID